MRGVKRARLRRINRCNHTPSPFSPPSRRDNRLGWFRNDYLLRHFVLTSLGGIAKHHHPAILNNPSRLRHFASRMEALLHLVRIGFALSICQETRRDDSTYAEMSRYFLPPPFRNQTPIIFLFIAILFLAAVARPKPFPSWDSAECSPTARQLLIAQRKTRRGCFLSSSSAVRIPFFLATVNKLVFFLV